MLQHHRYPFYERLAHYRDDLKAWADKNRILAQAVPFENFNAIVYVRPSVINEQNVRVDAADTRL